MKKLIIVLFILPIALNCLGQSIDPVEYASGNLSAQQQLLSYPLPRFKPTHTLNRNFIWFGLEYFSGRLQPGVTNQQMINTAKTNNLEFHDNWNYYFMVNSNIGSYSSPSNYADTVNVFNGAMTNIAKRNTRLKTSAICFWPQIGGNASNKNLSSEHYIRNASGQFLDLNGNVSSTKYWSPIAPNASIVADGQKQKGFLTNLNTALGRPVDILNENGEIIPLISRNGGVLNSDPFIRADYLSLGYPSTLNILSTNDYRGRRFTEQTNLYRDQFMSASPSTIFTHYGLDGQTDYRPVWSRGRTINSTIKGKYYPTGDFYPRWPNNWRGWMGPWHGLGWFADCKYWEEVAGDSLTSPFVSAGWDNDESRNVRPAQYLATLKILSNWGAEFFYSGYFSLSAPFPDSKGWGYQTVMPVYAQAITSRYESFLRRGYSLPGDVPGNFLGTTINSDKPKYLFRTGDNRQLVAVRKMYDSEKYIITTAQMVDANTPGNAPNISYGAFKLGSDSLRVEFRRQGSVYFYDKTAQVFYQLDKWHQREHPEYWSKDIEIEAEVADSLEGATIKTYNLTSVGNTINTLNTTSAVQLNQFTKAHYSFNSKPVPVGQQGIKHFVWVRVRNKVPNTTATLNINVNRWNTISYTCIADTNWTWYRGVRWFKNKNNSLILSSTGNVEVDKIIITTKDSAITTEPYQSCYVINGINSLLNNNIVLMKPVPTVTNSSTRIYISSAENFSGVISIFSPNNEVSMKYNVEVIADEENYIDIPVNNLANGSYYVIFTCNKGRAVSKFIKQ